MIKNKHVLITGANRGIGKSIAEIFASQGAHCFLNARKQGSLDDLCNQLRMKYATSVTPLYFDISQVAEVKNGFQQLMRHTQQLDTLVCNAGVWKPALLPFVNKDTIDDVFSCNTFGLIYCCQYAAKLMMRHKQGSIITISSVLGKHGNSGQVVYSGSKAAVMGITKSIAKELAPYNIRANVIAPGTIDTDLLKDLKEDEIERVKDLILLKRLGKPEEVAKVALFLASDLSSYVTGQVINVDGGMYT